MEILRTVADFQAWRASPALAGKSIGFVPTMGALHAGHAFLLERARRANDIVVLSIFVNPTQFNDARDFEKYPQPLEADMTLARVLGVDCVFTPTREQMYPDDYRYRITENLFSHEMEGAHRPGHFDGVLTVVMKLFMLVRADRAYFGEKDRQQLMLVRDMAAAFFLPTEIVPCPTVRADDGLALSSRNARLSPDARAKAPEFARILSEGRDPAATRMRLEQAGFDVDYVEQHEQWRFGAVRLENVRLIDNVRC